MMSSSNNPGPWNPNSIYRDCSQEICSIYCPQWCYIIYPPPPPFVTLGSNSDDDDSSSAFQFSPLIVALIGILASAFILITYYTIISRFCRRRSQVDAPNHHPMNNELSQNSSSAGLDESLIKSITVCKYIKGEGLIEGTDCSVCLSEFKENESLRLMPRCNHAFHLPCIDTWLKSNSSCPLCRSNVAPIADNSSQNPRNPPLQQEQAPSASRINISAMEFQQRNDAVIVIENSEQSCHQEITVDFGNDDNSCTKPPIGDFENGVGSDIRISKRSSSLNSCTSEGEISVADILNCGEDDEELQKGVLVEVGSSRGIKENGKSDMMKSVKSCTGIKRSVSTGRFVFTRCAKEKGSVVPN